MSRRSAACTTGTTSPRSVSIAIPTWTSLDVRIASAVHRAFMSGWSGTIAQRAATNTGSGETSR